VFQGLAEAETRIHRDPVQRNARRLGGRDPLAEKFGDLGHDVDVVRIFLHAARIALHVHQADTRLACGDDLQRTRRAQGVDVVDHVGAGGQRGAHHFRLYRIDRQRHAAVAQGFDHGQQAIDLLLRRYRGGPRPR
jgi:hypothetical protein